MSIIKPLKAGQSLSAEELRNYIGELLQLYKQLPGAEFICLIAIPEGSTPGISAVNVLAGVYPGTPMEALRVVIDQWTKTKNIPIIGQS